MSKENEIPEEIVTLSYIRLGDTYAIRFTLHGVPQNIVLVPSMDPLTLVANLYKTIQVTADPVGPCINEEPY